MKVLPLAMMCMLLASSLAMPARAQDESEGEEVEAATFLRRTTAWDIISRDENFSSLAGLIEANNLVSALNDPKRPVTVFAPTNAAIAALLAQLPPGTQPTNPVVVQILLQHVVNGNRAVTKVGTRFNSLNTGNSITRVRFNNNLVNAATFTINLRVRQTWRDGQGNQVLVTRISKGKSGVVFTANAVLLPNNAFPSISAAAVFYNYTTFAALVGPQGQNLTFLLDNPTINKTVFVPSNRAIDAISNIIANLTQPQLLAVLSYHVSAGAYYTVNWQNQTIPTLLQGQSLDLVAPNRIVASGYAEGTFATVVTKNIYFPGGLFQGIDRVLIPELHGGKK